MPEAVLIKMVDITNAAEQVKEALLDICVAWFKDNIGMCRPHDPVLYRLSKTTMLSILTEHKSRLSKRLPRSSSLSCLGSSDSDDMGMNNAHLKQRYRVC